MTQLVSWFVILTVLLSAIWVTRTILYDSIRIPVISAPAVAASAEDGAFQKQTGSSRTRETDAERRPAIDYGMSHVATPVEAPDQARTIFDSAMRAYWDDNTEGALTSLQALKRDHPDFEPTVGDSVDQLILKVETQLRYRNTVSRSATLAAARTVTGAELLEAMTDLAEIPPTDPRFGAVAELYRRNLQRKIDAIGDAGEDDGGVEAGDPEAGADDGSDDEADDEDDALDDDDLAAMALDEDGEVVEERPPVPLDGRTLMAQAREEARRLYQEGRYRDAARIFGLLRLEDGLTRSQQDQCLYLERKLLQFGVAFEEGMTLVGDPGGAGQGLRRLESALATDRILFRFYERLLRKEISGAQAVLARDALERGDLARAGEHMEGGLSRDPSLAVWGPLKAEIAALAMEHLDRARTGLDADPVRARRILKQVVAAAPTGSPAHEEASVLLEALDRSGETPSLPAEATF